MAGVEEEATDARGEEGADYRRGQQGLEDGVDETGVALAVFAVRKAPGPRRHRKAIEETPPISLARMGELPRHRLGAP